VHWTHCGEGGRNVHQVREFHPVHGKLGSVLPVLPRPVLESVGAFIRGVELADQVRLDVGAWPYVSIEKWDVMTV
jgi:hypothetical protein